MKRIARTKLTLNRDTLRQLTAHHLDAVNGGMRDRSDQGACPGPSLQNSACAACGTEVDCVTGGGCLTFEGGC